MLELPFNMTLNFPTLFFKSLPFAKNLEPELLNGAIALVAVGLTAAYIYYHKKPKGSLDPNNFKEFKLVKKTQISPNTAKFKFALPTPKSILGLPIGKNILVRGRDSEGKEVMRSYTPITLDSDIGYFELVVKMYPNGKMSHHFRQMKEGDSLAVKGPKGRFSYKAGQVRAFGMIAGGSGITPMFQLIRAILENKKDKTKVYLIYANVTVDDILLKEELDRFANKFPHRFRVYHVLNKPPNEWNGGVGFVSKQMIESHCPSPASDIQILRCGPPPMNKAIATHLAALGYTSNMQFEF
ncbi:NADH--cytochrome b5 reductase 1-like [Vicia villosa]|uniref:NADH--cytochrome b5 reductase 1-like n=1 Tax=Vicia villosa TaxID=3911 RepID=UPI00273B1392|nr:NADH--cytochrome b5 reductase 1-like [Vicia villosa]